LLIACRIQEEREERHKYKHLAVSHAPPAQQPAAAAAAAAPVPSSSASTTSQGSNSSKDAGSFDTGDPNTTNLYLGNLNPKISEQQLMEIFGRYGPLASIKIMWPRSEEEKQRGRNCGFVAYMSRKDAERALRTLNGRYIMGYEMRLGWGNLQLKIVEFNVLMICSLHLFFRKDCAYHEHAYLCPASPAGDDPSTASIGIAL